MVSSQTVRAYHHQQPPTLHQNFEENYKKGGQSWKKLGGKVEEKNSKDLSPPSASKLCNKNLKE